MGEWSIDRLIVNDSVFCECRNYDEKYTTIYFQFSSDVDLSFVLIEGLCN